MEPRFEELAERIAAQVITAVTKDVTDVVSRNITTQLGEVEARLSNQAHAHMEAVRSEARAAAEAYGGVLDGIDRKLERIEGTVTANHDDTSAILKNHNRRITSLEAPQSEAR